MSFAQYPSPLNKVFLEACAETGIPYNEDYNGEVQLGASMLQYTIKNNRRHSTATAFLRPQDAVKPHSAYQCNGKANNN